MYTVHLYHLRVLPKWKDCIVKQLDCRERGQVRACQKIWPKDLAKVHVKLFHECTHVKLHECVFIRTPFNQN
jgi:hypothetical protein